MMRTQPRLALLDEPFTNLDRAQRRDLLRSAAELWRQATLLLITHDIGDALNFERVLVFEGGRLVEDGFPARLASTEGSRFRELLKAEQAVRLQVWSEPELAAAEVLTGANQRKRCTRERDICGPDYSTNAGRRHVGRGTGGSLPGSEARARPVHSIRIPIPARDTNRSSSPSSSVSRPRHKARRTSARGARAILRCGSSTVSEERRAPATSRKRASSSSSTRMMAGAHAFEKPKHFAVRSFDGRGFHFEGWSDSLQPLVHRIPLRRRAAMPRSASTRTGHCRSPARAFGFRANPR